ncbi:hypothetical protein, partial [Leptospira interrogans]
MGLKIILYITFLSFNLLTGAESPVSEKQKQINNVEYNKTLKYKTTFLRKPPCCPLGAEKETRIVGNDNNDYGTHPDNTRCKTNCQCTGCDQLPSC